MRMAYIYTILLFMLTSSAFAQSHKERSKTLNRRLEKVEYYHIGVGMDVAGNENYTFSPKVYVGLGSCRNFYNIDLGFKIASSNLLKSSDAEYISYSFMPFFLSGSVNVVRWKQNCFYVGAELAYNVALGSRHHVNDINVAADDHSISQNHVSWQGQLGFRHKSWGVAVYYENDLSPALDQKYVYESPDYNYLKVYDSIFERSRIGLSVTYNFRF